MLATLAIHVEAWLQEELGVQRALQSSLARAEGAARQGKRAELEAGLSEVTRWLEGSCAREARRVPLLERLAAALGVPAKNVSLASLARRLAEQHIDTRRLEALRTELRGVVLEVTRTSRRLAALAQYHRGFLEELCGLLAAGAGSADGRLVDARG